MQKYSVGITMIIFMMLSFAGCSSKEPTIVKTYEVTKFVALK